jgi:putative transposase
MKNLLYLIIDAQSEKDTDTAMGKGYNAGKKVSGIKRHTAVDSQHSRMARSRNGNRLFVRPVSLQYL